MEIISLQLHSAAASRSISIWQIHDLRLFCVRQLVSAFDWMEMISLHVRSAAAYLCYHIRELVAAVHDTKSLWFDWMEMISLQVRSAEASLCMCADQVAYHKMQTAARCCGDVASGHPAGHC
jgi:uncharacterized paraquat-inducible protein A